MHGLRTSSVLILDDCDDDALRIQKSLALHGIGAILVPGAPDERRPDSPVKGVRLAVLDINLGFGNDAPARVRHTRGMVDELIDAENGPYVAVVWTANSDDYALFKNELQTIQCPPVLTVKLDKADVIELDDEEARAGTILNAIDDTLDSVPSLVFLNLWEQVVRDAANDTVVSLALAEPHSGEGPRALAFLAALLKSEADPGVLGKDAGSMRALLAALNPVHFDKVEEESTRMTPEQEIVVAPIREAATAALPDLTVPERADLNAALLFDRRANEFGAGRLYRYDDIATLGIGPALPDAAAIREGTAEKEHADRAKELHVVLLEVSAACDHQQGNVVAARLIAGVVFATENGQGSLAKPRSGNYLRKIEPLRIGDVEGFPQDPVVLVWNARYPVSAPADEVGKLVPIGRLREPLLADIRAWLGYQAGRPGYASIR